ncbi:STAS domain-containing protein [Pseudanabaena sp. PCC 6802]|uniref:STAS domain-containing protein n=1 Tax=Pseudanabaena sp. PCC 6802 TaxID=118173 RepID=UPI000348FC51|nr:STAS domain-containing protein [Pseudanabaena sp. PCC 6802]
MTTLTLIDQQAALNVFKSGSVLVIRPDSTKLDRDLSEELLRRVEGYFAANQLMNQAQDVPVLLDLQNVEFLDSQGLSTLLSVLKTASAHQSKLFLCSLQESVSLLFEITKMDRVFTIFEDLAACRKSTDNELDISPSDRQLIPAA